MNFVSMLNFGLKVLHLLNIHMSDFMFSDMVLVAIGEEAN
jgi:hypothetical protein